MSGDPRDFELDLVANTPKKIEAVGRFFGIIVAPLAPLDVQLDGRSPLRRGPGGSILLSQDFKRITLTSAFTQTVRVMVADGPQDVSNVTTGGGGGVGAIIAEEPSATVATPAPITITDGTAETIAANASRRRISIAADENNAGPVYVQAVGAGAGRGFPLAPGIAAEFKTVAALDVRNDTGVDAIVTTFEES